MIAHGSLFPRPAGATLIAGVGSALVDVLLRESEEFLVAAGALKGGMKLVEGAEIDAVVARSGQKPQIVCGGSACNTIVGVGNLGGKARFVGKRGRDTLGELFESDLRRHSVDPVLFVSDSPTGRVLSVVTPDAQRSMFTHLGASSEAQPHEFSPAVLAGSAIVHVEGYLLFNEALLRAALLAAKATGALVSLDLAAYTVVEAAQSVLRDVVKEYVDILIANEDEARVYTGTSDEDRALDMLASDVSIAVLKLGKRGSVIASGTHRVQIERMGSGSAVDTTGAGDLWAAGFLYGLVHGDTLAQAGTLGSACGFEVCQVIGAQIPPEGWARIRAMRDSSAAS
jgi:sugar/nucleoside kinase (ribokinase family)